MLNISELGLPDDHLLDDPNYVHYSVHRKKIFRIIIIIFTIFFILISSISIFVFIFTSKQHSLSSIKDENNPIFIRDHSRIKAGQIFSDKIGPDFNDSLIKNFTSSHYFRGIITRLDSDILGWFQCFYSTDLHPEDIIQGEIHGIRESTDVGEKFLLDKNEKISKVQVKIDYVQLYKNGIPSMKPKLIRNIRFFTTNGRSSSSIDEFRGEMFTEEFEGYTLAYLTGTSGRYINQLQFYWHQNINN